MTRALIAAVFAAGGLACTSEAPTAVRGHLLALLGPAIVADGGGRCAGVTTSGAYTRVVLPERYLVDADLNLRDVTGVIVVPQGRPFWLTGGLADATECGPAFVSWELHLREPPVAD